MADTEGEVAGYLGAFVVSISIHIIAYLPNHASFKAALFFGSNYVVCKKFPIGDGFAFQWVSGLSFLFCLFISVLFDPTVQFMSLGILIVGYINVPLGTEPYFNYWGLLGGSLWAAGNVMVPYIIRFIGTQMLQVESASVGNCS